MSKTNNKYSKEFKLVVVKRYLEGNGGYLTIAKGMNIKLIGLKSLNYLEKLLLILKLEVNLKTLPKRDLKLSLILLKKKLNI